MAGLKSRPTRLSRKSSWLPVAVLALGLSGTAALATGASTALQVATFVITLAILMFIVNATIAKRAATAHSWLASLFSRALLLRVVLAITLYWLLPLYYPENPVIAAGFITDDGLFYHSEAMKLAGGWAMGDPGDVSAFSPKSGFVVMTAAIYYLFGPNQLVLRIFNALIGSLIPLLTYSLGLRIGGPSVGRRAALWGAYLPTLVLYSAIDIRDIITSALVTAFFVQIVYLRGPQQSRLMFNAVLIAGLLFLFRPQWVLCLGAIVVLHLAVQARSSSKRGILALFLLAALMIAARFKAPFLAAKWADTQETVAGYQAVYGNTLEGPAYQRLVGNTPALSAATLLRLPIMMPLAVLTPFPLWVSRTDSFILQVDSIANMAWYALLPLFIYAIIKGLRLRPARFLTLVAVMIWVILTVYFFGSAAGGRYRVDALPLWVTLAALAPAYLGRRSLSTFLAISYGVLLVASVGYEIVRRGLAFS